MKRCPACNRTYPDDQNFCLDDGTNLSSASAGSFDSSDAPTVNYPYGTDAPPTVMMRGTPTTANNPPAPTYPPPAFVRPYAPPKRSPLPWIIGGVLVLAIGIALAVFLSSRSSVKSDPGVGGTTPGASPSYTPTSSPYSSSWQTIDDDGFTLTMPGTPSKNDSTVPSAAGQLPLRMYTLSKGYEGFITGYTEYPDIVFTSSEPEDLLNAAQQGAISNVKGEVTSQRSITLDGHPGREIVGTSPSQNVGFTARVFLVKPRMYMLVYTQYDKNKLISDDGKKFLDSFQLTK